jgi:hypothetical protein
MRAMFMPISGRTSGPQTATDVLAFTDADELFSGRFRLWKMRASVGMLYFTVFFWGACVLGDVFDVFPFTDLSLFVAMSVTLQAAAIWASQNEVSPLD